VEECSIFSTGTLYLLLLRPLGSHLRDAFQEGSACAVACLPVPRAYTLPIKSVTSEIGPFT
jgi:hypothetical protein